MIEHQNENHEPAEGQVPDRATFALWLANLVVELSTNKVTNYRGVKLDNDSISAGLARAACDWAGCKVRFASERHLRNTVLRFSYWALLTRLRHNRRCRSLTGIDACFPPTSLQAHWTEEQREAAIRLMDRLSSADCFVLQAHYFENRSDVELAAEFYGQATPAGGLRVFRLRRHALRRLGTLLLRSGLFPDEVVGGLNA